MIINSHILITTLLTTLLIFSDPLYGNEYNRDMWKGNSSDSSSRSSNYERKSQNVNDNKEDIQSQKPINNYNRDMWKGFSNSKQNYNARKIISIPNITNDKDNNLDELKNNSNNDNRRRIIISIPNITTIDIDKDKNLDELEDNSDNDNTRKKLYIPKPLTTDNCLKKNKPIKKILTNRNKGEVPSIKDTHNNSIYLQYKKNIEKNKHNAFIEYSEVSNKDNTKSSNQISNLKEGNNNNKEGTTNISKKIEVNKTEFDYARESSNNERDYKGLSRKYDSKKLKIDYNKESDEYKKKVESKSTFFTMVKQIINKFKYLGANIFILVIIIPLLLVVFYLLFNFTKLILLKIKEYFVTKKRKITNNIELQNQLMKIVENFDEKLSAKE